MTWVELSDDEYVRQQYRTTANLEARASVWIHEPDVPTPQDVAERLLRERGPNSVLEVGCGRGAFSLRIATNLDCKVTAIDSSSAMVDAARAVGVDASVGDVRSLPFEDDSFDAVVAAWMLYHVNPVDSALTETARVVRPGGRLVAITNGADHLHELWAASGETREEPTFSRENGAAQLEAHFDQVARIDVQTKALFASRAVAGSYLSSIDRGGWADRLSNDIWPLYASGATTVFCADKFSSR